MRRNDDHPPSYQYYPGDMESHGDIAGMSTLEFGAYMRICNKAWYETPTGSIPDDDGDLAQWARLSAVEWSAIRPRVLRPFKPCGNGRMIEPKLAVAYQKLRENSKKRSEAGKNGADKRWKGSQVDRGSDGNAIANAWQSHSNAIAKDGSSSSSSISSSTSKDSPKGEGAGKPPKKSRKANTEEPPQEFWDFYNAYPKEGRSKPRLAFLSWKAAVERVKVPPEIDGSREAYLIFRAIAYAACEQVEDGFVSGMKEWLQGDSWTDDPASWKRRGKQKAMPLGPGQEHKEGRALDEF